jgi:hypothetical protein
MNLFIIWYNYNTLSWNDKIGYRREIDRKTNGCSRLGAQLSYLWEVAASKYRLYEM